MRAFSIINGARIAQGRLIANSPQFDAAFELEFPWVLELPIHFID